MSGQRSLRARLLAGEQIVTALVRIPSAEIVEMLAVAGFDAVVIDCEHGPVDISALREHIALAQLHGMEALVRPGYADPATVLRALDHGATGIVAPHVDSVAEARGLVEAAHYPPLGKRGFATYSRAGRFGTVDATVHRRRAEDSTLVLAMIESPAAVAAAADILAVEGVDGYLVGTSDLAASSGPDDLSLEDALAEVRRVGREAKAVRADLAGSTDQAKALLADGSSVVVYNLTQVLMGVFDGLRIRP